MAAPGRIMDDVAALKRAGELTELNVVSEKSAAERVTVNSDNTPFLWRQRIGKRAWLVTFVNVSLKLPSAIAGYRDPYRRQFDVLLDEDSGELLSITSLFRGAAPDMRPQPSGEVAERQLSAEKETYEGVPAEDPRVTFLGALDIILSKGMGSPFLAKEIFAVYVMEARMGSPARPVWAITLRGIPPISAHGPYADEVPVWQRNHMRNVIDAKTGEFLFATNSPQPE